MNYGTLNNEKGRWRLFRKNSLEGQNTATLTVRLSVCLSVCLSVYLPLVPKGLNCSL